MIEDIASYCWDYNTAKELLEVIEAGEATLYIHSEGKGYTDIGILFPENNYLDRIRDDLRVYMIELRGIIRKVLRERRDENNRSRHGRSGRRRRSRL